MKHQREDLFRQLPGAPSSLALAAVSEYIVLPRVSVEIAVYRHPAFLEKPAYHQLRMPDGRIALPHHGSVLPVQILPGQGAPVVAHYDAVRIQHRHQLEDEFLSELLRQVRATLSRVSSRSRYFNRISRISGPIVIRGCENHRRLTLARFVSPVRKSMMPFIVQLDGVSPGCTRAVITTPRFLRTSSSWVGAVIVR